MEGKDKTEDDNKQIGFKFVRYSVPESAERVKITIEKKTSEEITFVVKTFDDTAKSPGDYGAFEEEIKMSGFEVEREIEIEIVDDDDWNPDNNFIVQLLDPTDMTKLPGADTETIVTILDEDSPGNIGFIDRFHFVKRKDSYVTIELERTDGSDGDITCLASTVNDVDILPGKRQAIEGTDFIAFTDQVVTFKANTTTTKI